MRSPLLEQQNEVYLNNDNRSDWIICAILKCIKSLSHKNKMK